MKITAEFNSKEEILDFLGLFKDNAPIKVDSTILSKGLIIEEPKKEKKVEVKKEEPKADDPKEKKVTKEEVRAAFTKLIKAGKQKEAKELTSKYGAKKLPEVKEEDYAAILKDVEELL